MSESTSDRLTKMRQQGYDVDAIRRAPDLERDGEDPGVVEVQNFLKHYGYFDFGPAAQAAPSGRGRMDDTTVRALVEFQMRYNVGTLGVLDAPTRELMAAPRCGLPDLDGGSSIRFATACAWDRRKLSYQFGKPGSGINPLTSDLPQGVVINAVRRALDTWAGAGAGLTFKVIAGGDIGIDADIRIEWRPAADPDYSMVGSAIAHADYPPGCSVVTSDYPKPLHFDDGESWVDGAVAGGFDIETVALHELGHLLGLKHNAIPGTVMYEYTSANSTLRELQTDDALGIRALYPVAPLFPIFFP